MQNRWLKNGLLSLLLVLLIGTAYAADAEIHRHPLPASSKELVWEPLPTDGTKLVPGNYYLDRDLINAFRDVVYNGRNSLEAIQEYGRRINGEIARKREEFGLA